MNEAEDLKLAIENLVAKLPEIEKQSDKALLEKIRDQFEARFKDTSLSLAERVNYYFGYARSVTAIENIEAINLDMVDIRAVHTQKPTQAEEDEEVSAPSRDLTQEDMTRIEALVKTVGKEKPVIQYIDIDSKMSPRDILSIVRKNNSKAYYQENFDIFVEQRLIPELKAATDTDNRGPQWLPLTRYLVRYTDIDILICYVTWLLFRLKVKILLKRLKNLIEHIY